MRSYDSISFIKIFLQNKIDLVQIMRGYDSISFIKIFIQNKKKRFKFRDEIENF